MDKGISRGAVFRASLASDLIAHAMVPIEFFGSNLQFAIQSNFLENGVGGVDSKIPCRDWKEAPPQKKEPQLRIHRSPVGHYIPFPREEV